MKTERRISPLELRLYAAALVAAAYTITWRVIDAPAPRAAEVEPAVQLEPVAPVAATPPIPAGWQRLSEAPPPAAAPARLTQVPRRRVRTRSS